MNFSFSIDTILSLIALFLAIGSSIYTWYFNRYQIELFDTDLNNVRGMKCISFSVANTSSRPIKISNVLLFHDDLKIEDNGFDPVAFDKQEQELKAQKWEEENTHSIFGTPFITPGLNPHLIPTTYAYHEQSEPFTKTVFLQSSQEITFSYYVDDIPNKIVIKSDKKIYHFKRKRSFPVNFD